jgi:DNA-binding MltR family transcriptional regulator
VKHNGSDSTEREARVEQIIQELMTESDRGCILVGANVLDDFLEEKLKTALVKNSHALKHAVAPLFGSMGPLGTFSAKIKLAYGLGLIPKYCFTDLEKIRRIRNVAAHEYSAMSFESPEIIQITRTLEAADRAVQSFYDKKFDTKPQADTAKPQPKISMERMRFICTVSYIASTLNYDT